MTITGLSEEQERSLRQRWRAWRISRRTTAVVLWVLGVGVTHSLEVLNNVTQSAAAPAAALALLVVAWGQLARRVDYRWFDGLCVLIPLYNLIWIARIVWRLTYRISPMPVRDWPSAYVRRESWVDGFARRVRAWST